MTTERGWMPGVLHVNAAGQGYADTPAGTMVPDAAVMHTIEGWQSAMMAPTYRDASYTFTIRQSDGRIVQHVSIFSPAWHAGRVDYVDAAGNLVRAGTPGARMVPPTWKLYRPGVNPNKHTIGISGEGRANIGGLSSLPLAWSEPQIESAIKILQWVGSEAGIAWDADTLTEHSQIAVRSRTDPGPRWPKARVLAALQPAPVAVSNAYVVQPGDTLSRIAARPGFPSVAELVSINRIADPNLIRRGQVLMLDRRAEPPQIAELSKLVDDARSNLAAAVAKLRADSDANAAAIMRVSQDDLSEIARSLGGY